MELIRHHKHAENISRTERVASLVGGGLLAWFGIQRRSAAGYALAAIGGDLIRRGATGYCFVYQTLGVRTAPTRQGQATIAYETGIRVDKTITINKPRDVIYRFWRNLENLPRFMKHLESVRELGGNQSHWIAKAPAGRTVEWDAEIINEKEGELIAWRSLPGADVESAGSVQFQDARGGRGTVLKVELQYNPPAGVVGAVVARLFGEEPTQQIGEDLRRFKALIEAGEIPVAEGQLTVPKRSKARKRERQNADDQVGITSESSFPASDAPSWNG
jgi:uncharacterized membrane protein